MRPKKELSCRYVVATPDLQEEDLTTEDETAILASDGLWDVVSNQDAITLIKDIKVGSTANRCMPHNYQHLRLCGDWTKIGDFIADGKAIIL